MAKAILIKQLKSTAQVSDAHKKTLKALGLRGIGSQIFRADTRGLRGMLNQVQHLISAEQTEVSKTSRPQGRAKSSGFKLG